MYVPSYLLVIRYVTIRGLSNDDDNADGVDDYVVNFMSEFQTRLPFNLQLYRELHTIPITFSATPNSPLHFSNHIPITLTSI